jgi:hypothetical protein
MDQNSPNAGCVVEDNRQQLSFFTSRHDVDSVIQRRTRRIEVCTNGVITLAVEERTDEGTHTRGIFLNVPTYNNYKYKVCDVGFRSDTPVVTLTRYNRAAYRMAETKYKNSKVFEAALGRLFRSSKIKSAVNQLLEHIPRLTE